MNGCPGCVARNFLSANTESIDCTRESISLRLRGLCGGSVYNHTRTRERERGVDTLREWRTRFFVMTFMANSMSVPRSCTRKTVPTAPHPIKRMTWKSRSGTTGTGKTVVNEAQYDDDDDVEVEEVEVEVLVVEVVGGSTLTRSLVEPVLAMAHMTASSGSAARSVATVGISIESESVSLGSAMAAEAALDIERGEVDMVRGRAGLGRISVTTEAEVSLWDLASRSRGRRAFMRPATLRRLWRCSGAS